jgi:hypothetical protein
MNYNKEFWNSIKKRMLEDRQNYLDLCHTKEEEVFKSSRYGQHREYFYVDGVIIEMPEIYTHIRVYKKYLLGV